MIRLAVRVDREQAELVLAELLGLSPGGVEETELPGGVIEYALYGAPGELPALPRIKAAAGQALVEVVGEEVPDDWETRWRRFHRPVVVGERLTVRPSWESPGDSELEVVIDPGQAFGTGAHPTTRLCLELLLGLQADGPFLDLGCGSGVLAVTAAKLGWSPVLALDHDPAAVEATAANARLNEVEIEVRRYDLRRDHMLAEPTTVANLLTPLLVAWARRLDQLPQPPRHLVLGGLLAGERQQVRSALEPHGLQEVAWRRGGEWGALLLGAT